MVESSTHFEDVAGKFIQGTTPSEPNAKGVSCYQGEVQINVGGEVRRLRLTVYAKDPGKAEEIARNLLVLSAANPDSSRVELGKKSIKVFENDQVVKKETFLTENSLWRKIDHLHTKILFSSKGKEPVEAQELPEPLASSVEDAVMKDLIIRNLKGEYELKPDERELLRKVPLILLQAYWVWSNQPTEETSPPKKLMAAFSMALGGDDKAVANLLYKISAANLKMSAQEPSNLNTVD